MAKIIIYTVGCPKCKQLEKKLKDKNIEFETHTDVDEMESLGISSSPYLSVDGQLLNFADAWKWVSGQGANGFATTCSNCNME